MIPKRKWLARGLDFAAGLDEICADANAVADPWRAHIAFELLQFMDGNGRTGRMLWAWMMQKRGVDPFGVSFLHRFYYQTLGRCNWLTKKGWQAEQTRDIVGTYSNFSPD